MREKPHPLFSELEELALAMRGRPRPSAEWAVRECMAMVAKALGLAAVPTGYGSETRLFRSPERVVEAMRLPEKDDGASEDLIDWLHALPVLWECGREGELLLHTPEGELVAESGDWIVLNATDRLCVALKDECFRALYQPLPRLRHLETAPVSFPVD